MARELLRPEEATNWDDFLERIAFERAAISARRQVFPPAFWGSAGKLLLVVSAAMRRADRDEERRHELDQLELAGKSHLEHARC